MKKCNNNIIKIIGYIITFVFFMWFIYFSYFTTKELLIYKYISPQEHVMKYNSWELRECTNPYSYRHENVYSNEPTIKELQNTLSKADWKTLHDKNIKSCLNKIYTEEQTKTYIWMKINVIKYGLATLFFFILFIGFTIQNYFMYRKND